jgi:hypothetical protein
MIAALATARSGLLFSVARLTAGSGKILNGGTIGPLPPIPALEPVPDAAGGASRVYQAPELLLRSTGGAGAPAGVSATTRPRLPAYAGQYVPSAPSAEGFVAPPNVDLAAEAVDMLAASLSFRANLAVFRAANEMAKRTLDMSA